MQSKRKDIAGGILFFSFGVFILIYAQQYDIGSIQYIGPGFMPIVLGGIFVILGATIAIMARISDMPEGRIDFTELRPLIFILAGLIVFGLILRTMGLIISLVALISIVRMAYYEIKIAHLIAQVSILTMLPIMIFVYGLGLSIPIWPG